MKKRFKHNFSDGDIITDTEFREIFVFEDKRDGLRAQLCSQYLRPATEKEKKLLKESGREDISY
jgi:hypothetical protein